MLRITVLITTYNREKCIFQLTKRLKELYPCKIVVVDDGSKKKIDKKHIDYYYKFEKNNGKKGWWMTVNKLFRIAEKIKTDYYIMTVDDALPNDNFFEDAIKLFQSIRDNNRIAMHLANNGREQNWTNFKREHHNNEVYKTQTTETSFISKKEFITIRIPKIDPNRWKRNPNLGSGVFPHICWYWIKRKRTIFGVKKSLLHKNPKASESEMNKGARKKDKWKLL